MYSQQVLIMTTDRACKSNCTVVDRAIGAQLNVGERWLGIGRHAVAGGPLGHAVAVMELAGPSSEDGQVAVHAFSPVGERLA